MKLSDFMVNEFINKKQNKELCLIRIKDLDDDESGNDLECNRYDNETSKIIAEAIKLNLFNMEVEDIVDEDDVLEVWIR